MRASFARAERRPGGRSKTRAERARVRAAMKILLTGVAGFIGSHLAERLLARVDEVVGLDNFDETLYPAAIHRRQLALVDGKRGFRFEHGDLLDAALVERLVADRPDAVVHLAALAGVR